MKRKTNDVDTRAKRIKLLLMDCDGVMTDGRIMLLENGDEQKTFNVRDGHGIVLFHRAGLKTGIISGRSSSFVQKRAWELGMPQEFVWQGCHNKIETFEDVLSRAKRERSKLACTAHTDTHHAVMPLHAEPVHTPARTLCFSQYLHGISARYAS